MSITWDENWIEITPIRYVPDQALSFARIGDVENDFSQTHLEIVNENASTAEATPAPNVLNLAISWQDIRIEFKSHFQPDSFSVQGMPFCDIPWKSDKGTPWKVGDSLLQVSQLHTSLPFPFAEIDRCKIRVFRVTFKMLPGRMWIFLKEPQLKTCGEQNKSCWAQLRKLITHVIVKEVRWI